MNYLRKHLKCNRINKAKVPVYSENMKLENFIILKPSINSSDNGIGKDLYRDKNPLKLRHKGVTYVTIDKLLSKVM